MNLENKGQDHRQRSNKSCNENHYEEYAAQKDVENRSRKEMVRESSGAAAYLENTLRDREVAKESFNQDHRIPTGNGHTEEEYNALPDDLRVELIDGVFYAMASPTRLHQAVGFEIARQIADCIDKHRTECFLYIAPSDVALGNDGKTIVQPDIYVHCNREKDKEPGPYRASPDLIVEVLSPSNPENDMWIKRELYRKHGVREYWIVNPAGLTVNVFDFGNKDSKDDLPIKYSFDEKVPVRISDGSCVLDFRKVYSRIKHLM